MVLCYQSEGNLRDAIHHMNNYTEVSRTIEKYESMSSDLFY